MKRARWRAAVAAAVLVAASACSAEGGGADDDGKAAAAPARPVVTTIDTGVSRLLAVAISPDGRFAYAAAESEIAVVELATARTIDTIPYEAGPKQIRFSRDGSRAYVASGTLAGGLGTIDTASHKVTGIIPVDGGPLYALGLSPDGLRIYGANTGAGAVVAEVNTGAVRGIPLPRGDRGGVAVSPDGRYAYFTTDTSLAPRLPGPRSVAVLDTTSGAISATIPVDAARPAELTISPDGRRLYLAHFPPFQETPNAVSVIDPAATALTGTIPVQGRSTGLTLSPDGRRLHILNESGTLQTADTTSGAVTTTVQVSSPANDLTIDPGSGKAYIVGDTKLHVIDLG
ncbi:PD40 domain-containing protein [Amycolatopsis sp. YIM 10]|uniref:PD40 domain-containing protein n=1 Tax=Amycolatopsis sp. YIM 10 TaxID=2653857 RepID=UPI0012A85B93|nr:PD40 domain-containing protein [Amycolatopsis sp. YIM 10]QFU90533.1 WD40-like Beta Propeller Repeat protein [Amycolatopsis sp. YIM 10]